MQERYEHFIGGAFVPAGSGRHLETTNPATGKPLAAIARGDATDVDAAVRAAESALPGWRDRRPIERGRVLIEIARRLREHQQEVAALEVLEAGKPAWQAPFEVEIAAQYFEFYGGLVNALGGETIDLGAGYHSYNQAARAAAPALAAGNVVVAKPSEFTSASLLELAQLAVECGLPAGALNVVTGTGPEAGAAIVAHGGVRKVAFTGSLRAGREVAHLAADRILPLTLELGGKSPNLVFADADLEQAVPGALRAFVTNAGQVCSAGTRLLLERGIHDRFVGALAEAVKGVRPGQMIGPMTTHAQYEKVQEYFAIARAEGRAVYPARFQLVATMNLCPCGARGDPAQECSCSPQRLAAFRDKLSRALLDRFDLVVTVRRVRLFRTRSHPVLPVPVPNNGTVLCLTT